MIIQLLSNPRNVSTALMYAFAQHRDFEVLDEPFYGYYLSRNDVDHPYRKEILATMPITPEGVLSWIRQRAAGQKKHLFIKNMAHHLRGLSLPFEKEALNILFIRHPRALLASFAKVVKCPTLNDIAIKDQLEKLHELEEIKAPVIVLDSSQLLADPELVLSRLLQRINIPFDKGMLTWPAGPKPYDGIWAPSWYSNVHQSTSFGKKHAFGENTLPKDLLPVLDEAMPYYNELVNSRSYFNMYK